MRYLTCFTLKSVEQALICIRNLLLKIPARIANESLSMRYLTCFTLKSVKQAWIFIRNETIDVYSENCKLIVIYAISHVFYVKKRQTSVDLHQKRNY